MIAQASSVGRSPLLRACSARGFHKVGLPRRIPEQAEIYGILDLLGPHRLGRAAPSQFGAADALAARNDVLFTGLGPLGALELAEGRTVVPNPQFVEGWLLGSGRFLDRIEDVASRCRAFAARANRRSPCFAATRWAARAITSAATGLLNVRSDIFPLPFGGMPQNIARLDRNQVQAEAFFGADLAGLLRVEAQRFCDALGRGGAPALRIIEYAHETGDFVRQTVEGVLLPQEGV